MEQNSQSNRLHALDGIRGIAILMVFLSHINATFINRSGIWGATFFNSGVLGVSFLFILSGFLMAYLYPQPKSATDFLQKRYSRIFPLFLTISSVIAFLNFLPARPWYISFGILLFFALIAHSIWVYIIKRYWNSKLKKILFFAFIFFQICVGIYYFWIMQHPAIFYYDQMSNSTRSLTNWLVNSSLLSLPIGRYVEMLDPVYWSLAAEVLFYILYPFICAPAIAYLSHKKRPTKIIFLICLFLFIGSITMLSLHILYLSLLRFQFFFYFVTGMTLAYFYRKYPTAIANINKLFPGPLTYITLALFFGFIFFVHNTFYPMGQLWVEMFLAIPATLLICIALSNNTLLAKFFRSKILVFIGTISYSLYLSHMFVLNLIIGITKQPTTLIMTTLYIFITFIISLILSSILYYLLEKPYFARSVSEKKPKLLNYPNNNHALLFFCGISLVFIGSVFYVFQSNLNFFTLYEPFNKLTTFKENAIIMEFKATHDNFGVISMHLINQSQPNKKFIPQTITFAIKEKGARQWYSTSQYTINQNTNNLPTSYGFPLIVNATGKTYIISISELVPSSSEHIILDNKSNNVMGVFFVDKKTLIQHPQQLTAFIKNKISTVMRDSEAQQILKLALPFFLFTIIIAIRRVTLKFLQARPK